MMSRNGRLMVNGLIAGMMALTTLAMWVSDSFDSNSWVRIAGLGAGAGLLVFFIVDFVRTLASPKDQLPTLDMSRDTRRRRVWVLVGVSAGLLALVMVRLMGIDGAELTRAQPWLPFTFLLFGALYAWILLHSPRPSSRSST
jgi:hypothetical protein